MSWLLALIPSKAKLYAALAAAVAVFLAWFRLDAQADQRRKDKVTRLEADEKTRKDIEDAVESSHAGGAAWIDRLRNLDK